MRLHNLHQQLSRNLVTNRLSHFDIFRMVKLIIHTYLSHRVVTLRNHRIRSPGVHTSDEHADVARLNLSTTLTAS